MSYLTKPTMVEAFQVTSIYDTDDLPQWAKDLLEKNVTDQNYIYLNYSHNCLDVGDFRAYKGDYVLLDKQGDLHVCSESLFKAIFRLDED